MTAADDNFAAFERKWSGASPENPLLAVFLPVERRRAATAFATLVHELEQAAVAVSEPQVAAAKLGWWHDELADGHAGRPRHPVTRELFADARLRDSDAALWPGLAQAALTLGESPGARELGGLLDSLRPWYTAVARAHAVALGIDATDIDTDARLSSLSFLMRSLVTMDDRSTRGQWLPLDLLARHGITRQQLQENSIDAAAFARDYLAALLREQARTGGSARSGNLVVRVRARLDRHLGTAALRAGDPLASLASRRRSRRWHALWACWREARLLAGS